MRFSPGAVALVLAAGTRMPPTGSPLDTIDLTNLKNWISRGAKDN